uniref:Uncharacterized protein n=1 Tax=Aegilops tauschii subsp. strangulata TaxID=200361 RepID=A0A453TAP3_AEGTS
QGKSNGGISGEQEDNDYVCTDEGKDDEATLSEEEELAKKDGPDPSDEIKLLQKESEIPLEELLARYPKDGYADEVTNELEDSPTHSSEEVNSDMSLDDLPADLELNNDTSENHEIAEVLGTEHVSGNALQLEIVSEPSVQECPVKGDELTDAKVMADEEASVQECSVEEVEMTDAKVMADQETIVQECPVKEDELADAKVMADEETSVQERSVKEDER